MVRFEAALEFGFKGDAVCAATLHELITEGLLEDGYTSALVQTMQTVTGTYLGYDTSQPPSAEINQVAMKQFADWINDHAASGRSP